MATPGRDAAARSRTAAWLRAVADQLEAGEVEVLRADAEWEIGEYTTSAPPTWTERGPTGIRTYTLELRHFADAERWEAIEAKYPDAFVPSSASGKPLHPDGDGGSVGGGGHTC